MKIKFLQVIFSQKNRTKLIRDASEEVLKYPVITIILIVCLQLWNMIAKRIILEQSLS